MGAACVASRRAACIGARGAPAGAAAGVSSLAAAVLCGCSRSDGGECYSHFLPPHLVSGLVSCIRVTGLTAVAFIREREAGRCLKAVWKGAQPNQCASTLLLPHFRSGRDVVVTSQLPDDAPTGLMPDLWRAERPFYCECRRRTAGPRRTCLAWEQHGLCFFLGSGCPPYGNL